MSDSNPDLLAIIAQALGRTDPSDRNVYLDRVCGDDAALRRRLDALLAEYAAARFDTSPSASLEATGPSVPETGHSSTGFDSRSFAEPDLMDMPGSTAHESGEATRTFDSATSPISRQATGDYQSGENATDAPADGRHGKFIAGEVIAGRYTLVGILGQGGMGTVYRAEQTQPVRRQVALKLIKIGMDSRDVLARFDAERQALALMEHPSIARVFDGGTTAAGQPFFVMELVEGEPITRYCDRQLLSVQARLELFVTVCKAVQHAHQKGIIHRDLKPGNVLVTEVDGHPTPKVIDFGVAKATGFNLTDQSLNDTGAIVGTPTYMSPEQADPSSMDIDTRTDVYALGVILYELLVGSPPIDARQFQRGAILEMLRMVREVEPPRPSTRLSTSENLPSIAANRSAEPAKLAKSLRGELDWVVMKALEKDRTRRYETASGFARDLERYLADEVVEARPPSTGYRLKKFVRRHKAQVVAASLVLISLSTGIVGTTIGLLNAREQRRIADERADELIKANAQTNKEKARAEQERAKADQNFATARALILDMGTRINQIETGQSNARLADLARKQALDKAREQFEQFRADRPDDEQVQMQAAALHRYAANVSRLLNEFPAANAASASAIKILDDLTTRVRGNSIYRNELALALSDRAILEKGMGRLKDSTATLDRAFALLDGTPISSGESTYRRTLALGLIELDQAEIAYKRGQFDVFARFADRASTRLDQLRSYRATERITVEPLFAAMAVKRRAMALRELGKTAEALAAHEDAVARMNSLSGPRANRDVKFEDCDTRRERALTATAVPERRAAAAVDLVEVIRVREKLVEDHPNIAFYREGLAADYLCKGQLLILLGKPDESAADLTKSLAVSRVLLDRHGPLSDSMLVRGQTFLALGRARAAAGKNAEAARHWKNAITVFEMALKTDPDNFHHQKGLAEARKISGAPR
jgi:serine/threonine protein kinase/tetratricopeptide (TPR) repeat protein